MALKCVENPDDENEWLQNQARLLPNERDGISVIGFSSPAMCKGVNGDDPVFLTIALMLALIALLPMIP